MNKIKNFFKNLFNHEDKPKFNVGDKVIYLSGRYYSDSYGSDPYGYRKRGKQVYVTEVNMKGTHPYHISAGDKLGSDDLGWLKEDQIELAQLIYWVDAKLKHSEECMPSNQRCKTKRTNGVG